MADSWRVNIRVCQYSAVCHNLQANDSTNFTDVLQLLNETMPRENFQYARYSILILLVISHRRFKTTDIPSSVSKVAPDFCTVYVIAKGKISHVRAATDKPPAKIPPLNPMQHQASNISDSGGANFMRNHQSRGLLL